MANGLAFSTICNKSIGMFSFYSLIFLSPSMKVLARPLGLAFFLPFICTFPQLIRLNDKRSHLGFPLCVFS